MERKLLIALALAGLAGSFGCRSRPIPPAAPAHSTATVPASLPPTPSAPMPTPTPTLPGLGTPVPTDVEAITPETLSRLRPIWRAPFPRFSVLVPEPESLIMMTSGGLMFLSPEDLRTIREISLPADTGFLRAIAVRPDGKAATVYAQDGVLRRVDLTTGRIEAEVQITASLRALEWVGNRAAILADGLRIWDEDGTLSSPIGDLPRNNYWGSFVPDGSLALTVDSHGEGAFWEIPTGTLVLTFTLPFTRPSAIAFHPQGHYAAVAGADQVVVLRVDRGQRKAEIIQTMGRPKVRQMSGGSAELAVLSEEGGGSRLLFFRWGDSSAVWNVMLPWLPGHIALDEARGRIYVLGGHHLEARRLEDGQLIGERTDLPAIRGIVDWEHMVVALAGTAGEPDIALLDLRSGTARWHQRLMGPVRSFWLDPTGQWLAAALEGDRVEFLELQGGQSVGRLELKEVRWLGPDRQGRGLIGLRGNTVLLWPARGSSPIWQRALPVPSQARLIGAASAEWIAVGTDRYADSIWILDHEGKIRETFRNSSFRKLYDLSWSSDFLLAYLDFGSSGVEKGREVWVLAVPGGQRQAHMEVRGDSQAEWWPDRGIGIVDTPAEELAITWMTGQARNREPLERWENVRTSGLRRIPNSAVLLQSAQRVKREPTYFRIYRGGWLRAFDLDQRKKVWEQVLPYSPFWMDLDPKGRWLILGSPDQGLEIWGVPPKVNG